MSSVQRTERQISHETFVQLDENGDGYISKKEFRNSLKNNECFDKDEKVDAAWTHFDKNSDGRISYTGNYLIIYLFHNQI